MKKPVRTKTSGKKPAGAKPAGARLSRAKPAGDKRFGDGEKRASDRPARDRPARSSERPERSSERAARSFDRPGRSEDGPKRAPSKAPSSKRRPKKLTSEERFAQGRSVGPAVDGSSQSFDKPERAERPARVVEPKGKRSPSGPKRSAEGPKRSSAGGKFAGSKGSSSKRPPAKRSFAGKKPTDGAPRVRVPSAAAVARAEARAVTAAVTSAVQTLTVDENEDGMRLDRWFKRRVPELSLGHLNKIVRTGQVRVDGARVDTSTRLQTGHVVRVPPLNIEPIAAPAVKRPVINEADARALKDMVLYEDRWVMALNKPYGLAVQGGSGTKYHIDGMLMGMEDEKGERPRLVHRLDRDTSGVLLIAKTRSIAADLGEIFRTRQTKKIYWAIVEGVPKPVQGRISLFLAKGPGMGNERGARGPGEHRDPEKMRIAKHGEVDARHSVTFYATVDKVAPRLAWLSMKPITGRTHQLRAHAEAIGHPIIGDPKYGQGIADNDPRRNDPLRAIPVEVERKLHLLARHLVLPHPKGGMINVTAPLPAHMQATFDLFGFDSHQYDPIEDAPDE